MENNFQSKLLGVKKTPATLFAKLSVKEYLKFYFPEKKTIKR